MQMWENRRQEERQLPYANFFHQVHGIGNKDMNALLDFFGTCEDVYLAGEKEIEKIVGEKKAWNIKRAKDEDLLRKGEKILEDSHIKFLCRLSAEYPDKLQNIPDAPFGIYVLGKIPENNRKTVAVIGARNCSQYGAHMAGVLGRELALAKIPVISGMARGIDGISQQAAVQAGGESFGVLGSGVDVCYPPSNKSLYRQLMESGGILSEYPPGSMPKPEHFPPRNRIISGLSDVVVVVEAKQKSGTLITVDMALEQGKEIYCVPGRVTDKLSEGCNKLIGQGAGVILSVEDFFEKSGLLDLSATEWGKPETQGTCADISVKCRLEQKEYALWKLLDFEPLSMEQLYIQLVSEKGMGSISMPEMMTMLTNLVLLNMAENVGAGYYAKKG